MESLLETAAAVKVDDAPREEAFLADLEQNALRSDYLGISLSWICLLHCLLLPFLVPFVPFMVFFTDEWIHPFITSGMIAAALWAFVRGYKIHKSKSVLALGVSGVLMLFGIILGTSLAPSFMEQAFFTVSRETALSVLASILLISAHLRNISSCRCRPLSTEKCSC